MSAGCDSDSSVFSPARLLVTGGAGFIGCNFVRFILRARPSLEVVNFDLLSYAGDLLNIEDLADEPRHHFVQGDIRDRSEVERAMADCDAVVNLAAETHVDRSILDSAPFVQTNVLGTQVLLDVAMAMGIRRFVQASTDEVYGSLALDGDERFSESSPLKPNSPYAASKAAADLLALSYERTFEVPVIVTRCSNNFGPYQFPEKLIPLFVSNLLEGRKVPVYGDGRNVRDWIHVDDHSEALLVVLERGTAGEVYNIGADNERSNLELTDLLLDACGLDSSYIEFVKDRPGHDLRYAVDAAKIRNELRWEPRRSAWPSALIETVKWYEDHQEWCVRIRKRGDFREYYERQYGKF